MKIMASGPITSWEIDGETVETESDFILGGSKITADGDCSHEIKRHLLLGRKAMTNLDSVLKSRDVNLSTKFFLVKAMIFRYSFSSITLKVSKQGICSQKLYIHRTVQFSSVAQSCPTLCDPMNRSITISRSSLRLTSIESVRPSSHLILCRPLLLPPIPPSIRVFSSESTLPMRWPKY